MPRFRMTKAFRAEWARILAGGEYEDAERAKLRRRGEDATEANRARVLYSVAMRVCDRWQAAGFTSATLVDGLPRPERPHATTWHTQGRGWHCEVCGRHQYRAPTAGLCDGPGAFNLIHEAVAQGVPFGLVDGLPTAGVPTTPGDVVTKLARATCRPRRREERQAA